MIDLFTQIKEIAFSHKTSPTYESLHRWVLRYYSHNFHTPLYIAETLDLEHVYLNVYEDLSNKMSEEDLDYTLNSILNPNLDQEEEEDLQDFMKTILNKEKDNKPAKSLDKPHQPNDFNHLHLPNAQSLSSHHPSEVSRQYSDQDFLDSDDLSSHANDGLESLDKAIRSDDGE